MAGECVISSVLSHQGKNLKQRTSVTARLQLSFIWQAKENTSLKCEGRPAQKTQREEGGSILAPFFCMFFLLPPLSLPYANWASQEAGVFVSPEFSLQSVDFLLFHFHGLFPFFVF